MEIGDLDPAEIGVLVHHVREVVTEAAVAVLSEKRVRSRVRQQRAQQLACPVKLVRHVRKVQKVKDVGQALHVEKDAHHVHHAQIVPYRPAVELKQLRELQEKRDHLVVKVVATVAAHEEMTKAHALRAAAMEVVHKRVEPIPTATDRDPTLRPEVQRNRVDQLQIHRRLGKKFRDSSNAFLAVNRLQRYGG